MADQGWQEDIELKDDLQKYVESNLQRKEILDFVKEKYPLYAWSLRTFCRRLKHFGISYIDYNTNLDHVEEAVREEMDGRGRMLGYRALHKKVEGPRACTPGKILKSRVPQIAISSILGVKSSRIPKIIKYIEDMNFSRHSVGKVTLKNRRRGQCHLISSL